MKQPPGPLRSLTRAFGLGAALVTAGTAAGAGYALIKTPEYTATAHVIVVTDADDSGPAAVNFAQVYGRLATLPETLRWGDREWPSGSPRRAAEHLRASTSPDAPLIRVTGTATGASDAAAFANAGADALVRFGAARRQDTGVRIALMSEATPPLRPSSPRLLLDIAVGAASGVLLAGLAAMAGLRPTRRRRSPVPTPPADAPREEVAR
ncbi:Wzz/FepE/Etk N-terminal domain-containing protein [Actinomadura flavalba]|uniref:Wzz/FepE/Etk N-terminal domain-containing protein n=1 Tax=Actinomadura flavalba TaxID=1120938 RepID=UPI000381AC49|nr:Wzz/FepE/Etk N-terminal domain-containing protein [Actinomadura flavalba]